jgi:PII-like signaling protein
MLLDAAAVDMNYFDEILLSSHYLYVIVVAVDTLAEIEHFVDAVEEIVDVMAAADVVD